jgi:sulfatase modifying factor 1
VSGGCDCHDVTCGLPCPPPLCPNGDTVCANSCVNAQADSNNCGYCGVTCAPGQTCQGASCVSVADAAPLTDAALLADAGAIPDASSDGAMQAEAGVALDGEAGSQGDAESLSTPPSCQPGGLGMTHCAPGGNGTDSCCTSLEVTGGTYFRTYDPIVSEANTGDPVVEMAADGGPTEVADPASVSSFRLDEYLVTVGRFRQFVNAWKAGWLPAEGSGKHTHLNGGLGLINVGSSDAGIGYEPGWLATDDSEIAPTDVNLRCENVTTWTASPASNESLPIDCVAWYEAYAFCIWDGGFLPSEAESEYAAAGGGQQREYPWGSNDPGTGNQYAIFNCQYTALATFPPDPACEPAPVGTPLLGAGRWGQLDLAGEVYEWNLDWFSWSYVNPCADCAYLPAVPPELADGPPCRVVRGGDFGFDWAFMPAAALGPLEPPTVRTSTGFRCARSP